MQAGHGHGYGHGYGVTATGRHRGRLAAVMAISTAIAVLEVAGALVSGSLVLFADAAHMAADAAGGAVEAGAAPAGAFTRMYVAMCRASLSR